MLGRSVVGNDQPVNFYEGYKNIEIIGDGKSNIEKLSSKLSEYSKNTTASKDQNIDLYLHGHGNLERGMKHRKKTDEKAIIALSKEHTGTFEVISDAIDKVPNINNVYIHSCHSGALSREISHKMKNDKVFNDKDITILTGAGAKYAIWGDDAIKKMLKDNAKGITDPVELFARNSVHNPETKTLIIIKNGKLYRLKAIAPKHSQGIENLDEFFNTEIGIYDPNNKEHQNCHIQLREGNPNDPELQSILKRLNIIEQMN